MGRAASPFSASFVDGVTVFVGEMEIGTRDRMEGVFADLRAAAASGDVVIDVAGVRFCDSSGLNQIARLYRALGPGCVLTIRNPDSHLRRTLDITGVSQVVKVEP